MNPPAFLTAQFIVSAILLAIVANLILVLVAGCIYLERKLSAYIQDRCGPNRVGLTLGLSFLPNWKMAGLGQALADGLKFYLKEDYAPHGADRTLFTVAPASIIAVALLGFAIIPWGGVWICPTFTIPLVQWTIQGGPVVVAGAAINVGVVYLLACASLGLYGIVLGSWASNNKFSFLGGMRCAAQMLCYEIPIGLMVLCVLLLVGSLMPLAIVQHQLQHGWLIFSQPLAGVILFIAALAEANRVPFDNAECENELVGGYHTEYSSMRFALYFLAEYANLITSSAFFVLLFLGGWELLPFVNVFPEQAATFWVVLAKFAVFMGKTMTVVCFAMVVRWTIPRLRYDQVMSVAWQAVIPLSLVLVVATAVMIFLELRSMVWMLAMNAALAAALLVVQPMIPRVTSNRRVRLAGSRFFPLEGEESESAPRHPVALDDRPMTAPAGLVQTH
ncbi:MAG: NADH-quinone oxidoreductase subunit H [Phycisphaeraceae bacterium]|nr:NADH-quinone oxidoreductase subunit H [Phycisphaeraceae bacterium]